MMTRSEQYQRLCSAISGVISGAIGGHGAAAVAFSGGVDSALVCAAAFDALGSKAIAVTIVSPMLPAREIEDAKRIAGLIGIEHALLPAPVIEDDVAGNPVDRCYHCKKHEFGAVIEYARARGIHAVLDGSNADDEGDYRPGMRAVAELGVISPLRDARLTKLDVRALAKERALPIWDKPAFACLASRIPYGETIDIEKLAAVERAEAVLTEAGFRQARVRRHSIPGGALARIEVAPEERSAFFNTALLDDLSEKIKKTGFVYAAFELAGYATGSMNAVLNAMTADGSRSGEEADDGGR
ncbi:MAG: ATP-dependent sacrificial sulfur transferase LarE [Treponema sp.]|jgi:uncharacterized protein|nr:ATP-dependent sacrificial sulfur transferase LarE [Treponema sp.]